MKPLNFDFLFILFIQYFYYIFVLITSWFIITSIKLIPSIKRMSRAVLTVKKDNTKTALVAKKFEKKFV